MFKKISVTVAFATTLLLAACNSTNIPTAAEIQSATLTACNFVPTGVEIAAIAGASTTVQTDATTIANALCGALKASTTTASTPAVTGGSRKLGAANPVSTTITINGVSVKVTGYFVK